MNKGISKSIFKTRDMILVALFTALTVVGAYISIPIPPVPVTFQNLICILAGGIIGSKKGALSQILYTGLGLIGLPVFAGGKGGFDRILSPTFGYILGFILCAYIVGKLSEKLIEDKDESIVKLSMITILGTLTIYAVGTAYLYLIMNFVLVEPMSIMSSIKIGIAPFFIKDTILAIFAAFVIKRVSKALVKSSLSN